jgi:ABC-type nitrate/sulfonate/bicarbonate transport system substrate-binding protein
MNSKLKILFVVVILLAIAGLGWVTFKKFTSKSDSVIIRELQSTAPNQWELAKKLTGRNILVEEGVKLDLISTIQSSGGTTALQALLADNIDVCSESAWPPYINIIARGGKIKALLGITVSTKDNEAGKQGLLVLEDSSIHTIKDLVGKRIAVNVLGAEADYVIRLFLKKNGLSISQVELVSVPLEKQEQMLRSRQVDAACIGRVYYDLTLENGGVRQIPGTTNFETKGEAVASALGFRNDFIDKHPDVVKRYLRAYDVTRRIIYNEFQNEPERVRKAYADISIEKGSNPRLAKYFRATLWTPDYPFIADKDVQWWLDRFIEDGLLKPGQLKPSDIYTNEFNPLYKKK